MGRRRVPAPSHAAFTSRPDTVISRRLLAGRRLRRFAVGVVVLTTVVATLGTLVVATDTFGAGKRWESLLARVDRFLRGPVPDRPTLVTVLVTEPPPTPSPSPGPTPRPTPSGSPLATAAPTPEPTPTPEPAREPIDVRITGDPNAVFASELTKEWCAVAGVQMVLAQLGLVDTSDATQKKIAGRIGEWESWADSHNGDWGPAAMVLALEAYGAPGYEIRAFKSRQGALRDAARALQATGAPVILLAWRGAHTWVMSGFRADADPTIFPDAQIEGTYILDPWYPRVSSIWGASDPPGTFQDGAEMVRNYLPWKRPEGRYPDRDGLFLIVAPTIPVAVGR
jgi:hypothetical protein